MNREELTAIIPVPEEKILSVDEIKDMAKVMRNHRKEITQADIDKLNGSMMAWNILNAS